MLTVRELITLLAHLHTGLNSEPTWPGRQGQAEVDVPLAFCIQSSLPLHSPSAESEKKRDI